MRPGNIGWMVCAAAAMGLLAMAAMAAVDAPADPLEKLPTLKFRSYKVAPFIRAAVALQALGKDKACELLRAHSKDRQRELYSGVFVLSRMLFVKKADGKFRRPLIGGAAFVGGTDYEDWPLEPIEIVDGVPFIITRGYMLGGSPESAESYVLYCMEHCDWNEFR